MAKSTRKVPQIDCALLTDHVANIWQRAILGDWRAGSFIPLRVADVSEGHNAVRRVVDRGVENHLSRVDPVVFGLERRVVIALANQPGLRGAPPLSSHTTSA